MKNRLRKKAGMTAHYTFVPRTRVASTKACTHKSTTVIDVCVAPQGAQKRTLPNRRFAPLAEAPNESLALGRKLRRRRSRRNGGFNERGGAQSLLVAFVEVLGRGARFSILAEQPTGKLEGEVAAFVVGNPVADNPPGDSSWGSPSIADEVAQRSGVLLVEFCLKDFARRTFTRAPIVLNFRCIVLCRINKKAAQSVNGFFFHLWVGNANDGIVDEFGGGLWRCVN
jgi:hypothetical protein